MTELLVVMVLGLATVAAATVVGPRLGIASPLVLVAIGVAASFVPVFAGVEIRPEWILEGLLPPLLYSSAVSMPAMNFRREFAAIGGLSVVLVVLSALVLGWFFTLVIPGLGFGWGVALGAVVSPTDAVATSIIKQTRVSKRVVALLDGESLLNDATALVLLRTAIAAAGVGFSFWGAVGTFALSVVVAVVVGWGVGSLDLFLRRRVDDPTVNTVMSFTVPFVAYVPAELLHGSGLVAAVVAGLITGIFGPRFLSPQARLSDSQNWRTVELVLEGAVFLTMGVQISSIVTDVRVDHPGLLGPVLIGAGALALTVAVRAAYIVPLLRVLTAFARHGEQLRGRLEEVQGRLGTTEGTQEAFDEFNNRPRRRKASARELESFATRVTRVLADIEYFVREPLGWREGVVVVWAGMRGAVTVAAAQGLPENTPERPVLVLVAFVVAALSLLLQGGTIGPLVRRIEPEPDETRVKAQNDAERDRLFALLRSSAETVTPPEKPVEEMTEAQFVEEKRYRLAVLRAQRSALLDARDNGTFDADVLARTLANLDASQIDVEMRG